MKLYYANVPFNDSMFLAPVGLTNEDFAKSLALVGGDASGSTVVVSPIPEQNDTYDVTITVLLPGRYVLEVATLGGTYQWNADYDVESSIILPSLAGGIAEKVMAKGFAGDMFGVSDADLLGSIAELCADKSIDIRSEIGEAAYASTNGLVMYQVEKAIIELATAELWGRRKARILRAVMESGEARNRAGLSEENSKEDAMNQYLAAISHVYTLLGRSSGSFGVTTSNHFGRTE